MSVKIYRFIKSYCRKPKSTPIAAVYIAKVSCIDIISPVSTNQPRYVMTDERLNYVLVVSDS